MITIIKILHVDIKIKWNNEFHIDVEFGSLIYLKEIWDFFLKHVKLLNEISLNEINFQNYYLEKKKLSKFDYNKNGESENS